MILIPDLAPWLSRNVGWLNMIIGLGLIYVTASWIYSIFLSPLSKYPGPRLWAISTIPYDIHLFRGKLPFKVAELHKKYGPIIRIGPNELSYITEDAWNDIYGKIPGKPQLVKKTRTAPGPPRKYEGLFRTKNDADHARMRRNFSNAFSDKALREQEPIMKKYFDLLIQRLHENCAKPVDIVQWYNSTTFDLVGDLLFGESYECLEKSRLHMWVAWFLDHVKVMIILGFLKRISPLDSMLIWMLPKKFKESGTQFRDFHTIRLDKRLKLDTHRLDLMSHARKMYNTPEGMNIGELGQTCELFVIAGSETTATLLSGVTYLLSKNPEKYQKLVNEIRLSFGSEDQINIANTSGLKYESAVLDEALRMFPPVGGSQCRYTPSEGHVICGQFIPGNTLVAVNQWSANHASYNFKDAYKFIPERWLGDPKYKNDRRKVFQPFSVGPRNCIGLNLAYAEMRVILARILWNFDIELCEESSDWMDRLEVYTLWRKMPLMVKLTPVRRAAKS